jgi:hypothetical protein
MLYRSPPSPIGQMLYRLFIDHKDRVILLSRNPNSVYVNQWLTREGYTSPYHIVKTKPPVDPYDEWLKGRFTEALSEGWRQPVIFDNDPAIIFLAHRSGLGISLLAEPDRVLTMRSRPAWDDLVSSIEAAHMRKAEQEVQDGNS